MMIVKEQTKITFINNCNAIFDEEELSKAIMWYSTKPVISKKHIYMYGCYPAISIHDKNGKDRIGNFLRTLKKKIEEAKYK